MAESWLKGRQLVLQQQEVGQEGEKLKVTTPEKRRRNDFGDEMQQTEQSEVESYICDQGLMVLTDPGESQGMEGNLEQGGGDEGMCDFDGGIGGLGAPLEDLNPIQESEGVISEDGRAAGREFVELFNVVQEGGEIEMVPYYEYIDDSIGEVVDEENGVEIVIRNEPEATLAKEKLECVVEAMSVKDNIALIVPCESVNKKKRRTVTKRDFFMRLKK